MTIDIIQVAAISLDTNRLGAAVIILAVTLGVVGMIANGILRARSVKRADKATHDRIEKALHDREEREEKAKEKESTEETAAESSEEKSDEASA